MVHKNLCPLLPVTRISDISKSRSVERLFVIWGTFCVFYKQNVPHNTDGLYTNLTPLILRIVEDFGIYIPAGFDQSTYDTVSLSKLYFCFVH